MKRKKRALIKSERIIRLEKLKEQSKRVEAPNPRKRVVFTFSTSTQTIFRKENINKYKTKQIEGTEFLFKIKPILPKYLSFCELNQN